MHFNRKVRAKSSISTSSSIAENEASMHKCYSKDHIILARWLKRSCDPEGIYNVLSFNLQFSSPAAKEKHQCALITQGYSSSHVVVQAVKTISFHWNGEGALPLYYGVCLLETKSYFVTNSVFIYLFIFVSRLFFSKTCMACECVAELLKTPFGRKPFQEK